MRRGRRCTGRWACGLGSGICESAEIGVDEWWITGYDLRQKRTPSGRTPRLGKVGEVYIIGDSRSRLERDCRHFASGNRNWCVVGEHPVLDQL